MKEDRSFSRNRTVLRDKLRKKIVLPLFLLQMLCSFTQVSYAQEVQLNLKLENSTLLDALKKIGTATGTEFFYNAGQIGTSDKRITREFRNTPLRSALEYVLNGTPFTFKIEDKTIIITQRPAEPQKTEMKIIELKGIVVDSHTKEPLPGVTVMIEGTTQGTATDVNGQFTFPLGPAEYNIIFSYIGYERLVKKFNGNNVSDFQKITLVPVIEEMDEVVVTGIFTRKGKFHGIIDYIQSRGIESRGSVESGSKSAHTRPFIQNRGKQPIRFRPEPHARYRNPGQEQCYGIERRVWDRPQSTFVYP